MDADVNADADAVVTAIALSVLTYRRAKKKLYDSRIFAPRFTDWWRNFVDFDLYFYQNKKVLEIVLVFDIEPCKC